MTRIVLACWGSYGDLFPYLGIAAELKARGHTPAVATCPLYRELIETAGLDFQPVRPDLDPLDTGLITRVMDPARGSEVVVREMLVPHLQESYDDLVEATRGADLLVSHPVTFAAPIVATERGLPWLASALSPVSFFSVYDFPVLPPYEALGALTRRSRLAARAFLALAKRATAPWTAPVRAFRAQHGLRDEHLGDPLYQGQFSPHGTLALFSPIFGPPQPDWPALTTATGFVFYNRPIAMPDRLADFLAAGTPPIVFTLGSSAVGAPGAFYQESVKAAAALGRRAVLLVGRYAPALTQAGVPDDMLVVDVAPHDAVFPHAAVTVHHGGIGTTGQALRAGQPTLVVPHAHDQPDNAARVTRLGVGRTLDARHYDAERATRALDHLLNERSYAERAADVGRALRTERGAATACDAIERVAAGRVG